MTKRTHVLLSAAFLVLSLMPLSSHAFTYDKGDLILYPGIEAENVLIFCSSILAFALFIITAMAYKRDKRAKFLYVTVAFLLFAIKGFIEISEMFFPQAAWVDLAASLLDFAILASFFFGILKK